MARPDLSGRLTDGEKTAAFNHVIKFILVGVVMNGLDLTRLQAVEAEHQVFSLEKGGLVKLVGFGPDVIAVMNNISWHN
jgi:hypothetical protein